MVVFGSGARADPEVVPGDLDLLIRLGGPLRGRAARYFALRDELQDRLGLSVDLVEEEALQNPHLKRQVDDNGVEIVAAA